MLEKLMRLMSLLQSEDEGVKVILFDSVHKALDSAIRIAERTKAARIKEADKIIKKI